MIEIQILNALRIRVLPMRLVDAYRLLRSVFPRRTVAVVEMPMLEVVEETPATQFDSEGWEFTL